MIARSTEGATAPNNRSPASQIRQLWDRLLRIPRGALLFSLFLGRRARYSGSIHPRVLELREGYARVAMADRPAVRNHLRSIHAIAIMNLAELTTGLALHYGMPGHARGILTRLSIDFLKKARGRLIAEARAPVPDGLRPEEVELDVVVLDGQGDTVARASARWLVGPREDESAAPD